MADQEVFDLMQPRPMSLAAANSMLGVFTRITTKHSKIVNDLISLLETLPISDRAATSQIEAQISKEIEIWNTKVRKLGAVPKGLWLVDIDAGDGYYCWKFPESEVQYWHEYNGGYANRISLREKEKIEQTRECEVTLRESRLL